jgi:phosphohistidine phosphatase
MDIYLLRHGIAEDTAPGGHDSERALTREGREKLNGILKRAREAGVVPGVILSSPYRRAVETAEIAAEILNHKGKIVCTPALTPNASPGEAWQEIRRYANEEAVLLASHEPLLSSLLAHLLAAPSLQTDFKKGAIARVTMFSTGPSPRGVLKWLLTPALT